MRWYKKAIAGGYLPAMRGMGQILREGEGVPQDMGAAFEWYRKGAERGDVASLVDMGICYGQGEGVPKDLTKATECLRKAALDGEVEAWDNLGQLLLERANAERELASDLRVEAVMWFRKPAALGHARAASTLAACMERGYDEPRRRGPAEGLPSMAVASRRG
jgi:TPR repeat protein